jgi:adenine deaminase
LNDRSGTSLLMDVAAGVADADVVVAGGRLVNTYTRETVAADIAISDGRVAAILPPGSSVGGEVIDASGQYICPGLIDAHFHIGGSHMDVERLSRALLARGTTAIATDFYEIYVAGGPAAVRFAIDEAKRADLKVLFVPPAHLIGLEQVGTFAWDVSVDDMRLMLAWPETVGINEPPAAAVLARTPGLVELLDETIRMNKVVVGHAPGAVGLDLQAYASAGADSDHESRDAPEALAKLRAGMRPMMRHGSASPDMLQLIELAIASPMSARYMMFCSDETDPGDLATDGHMDVKLRLAIEAGLDPMTALEMATINTAEYYRVNARIGSIAPGRSADLLLVGDLRDFHPSMVIASGRVVGDDRALKGPPAVPALPASLISSVSLAAPIEAATFRPAARPGDGPTVRARVLGVHDGTLVSEALERELRTRDGFILPDAEADILSMAVIERHHGSGRVGHGFVSGYGFRDGAVAMTYCHVFHNMLVIGTSEDGMAAAARAVVEDGGGVAVFGQGAIIARWRLPIVGVLDERPLDDVAVSFAKVNDALRAIGCPLGSPVLSLSFVALPTIGAYGLTDRGLFDVERQMFVDVLVPDDR